MAPAAAARGHSRSRSDRALQQTFDPETFDPETFDPALAPRR
jgi:hypothetical protein